MARSSRPVWLQVGKDCVTRGGWKARVVWIHESHLSAAHPRDDSTTVWVVHEPGKYAAETPPIAHRIDGKLRDIGYVAHRLIEAEHPSDLIGPWEEKRETDS